MLTLTFITGLVIVQAAIAFLIFEVYSTIQERDLDARLGVGDPIVYRKQKVSAHPCARAYEVRPFEQGDNYSYIVDKYWTVGDILSNGLIVAVTRTNKRHCLRLDDPNLYRPGYFERLRNRDRFPRLA